MNATFLVRMAQGTPQFPRPAGLAEDAPWTPDYWALESVEGKEWARYQMNNLTQEAFEACVVDAENYRDGVAVEEAT